MNMILGYAAYVYEVRTDFITIFQLREQPRGKFGMSVIGLESIAHHALRRAPAPQTLVRVVKKRKRGIRSLVSWRQLLVPLHDSSQRLQTHFHQSRVLFISNGFGQFWNVGLVQCGAVLGNVHEHGLRIVGR